MPAWDRLDVRGPAGPIRNTYLRQGGTRLAAALPGGRSGWATPALYYPVLAMLDEGLDVVCLDSIYDQTPSAERLCQDATAALRAGTASATYEQVVLAGKSLGTLAMAELILHDPGLAAAPTVWLTPLLKAVPDRRSSALVRALKHVGQGRSDAGPLAKGGANVAASRTPYPCPIRRNSSVSRKQPSDPDMLVRLRRSTVVAGWLRGRG